MGTFLRTALTENQINKRLFSIQECLRVFTQTPEYSRCPDIVEAMVDKIHPNNMPDIDFMLENCTSSKLFSDIKIDKCDLPEFCKEVENRVDIFNDRVNDYSNKDLFNLLVDSSNWFGYISSLKYESFSKSYFKSNLPWITNDICNSLFEKSADGLLIAKSKVIDRIMGLAIDNRKQLDLLNFILEHKYSTSAFSHVINAIVINGYVRFSGENNKKEYDAFNAYTFLLMFNMKLCSFNTLMGYQTNLMIEQILDPDKRDVFSRQFDLAGSYLQSMKSNVLYSKFIMERWLHLLNNLQNSIDTRMSSDNFRKYMSIQSENFNAKYLNDLKTNRYFNAISTCFMDYCKEDSIQDMIIGFYKRNLFNGNSLLDKVERNDLEYLKFHSVIRISEYSVNTECFRNGFYKVHTLKIANTFGEPRVRPSSFISGRALDLMTHETDQYYKRAIEKQIPVFGYGIRYKTQPPFVLFPVVQNGEVRKIYWFAPDIEVEDGSN